ncbi:MAG TPA: hypothetical protein PKC73_00105 [Dermatophilaceae bacterium]|jgi:hypothetical protein|nr:hypothetical protein [Dermatophilaceae bacterium]
MNKKIASIAAALAISVFALTGCTQTSLANEQRSGAQEASRTESLSRDNQEERMAREEDESQIRYVYILAPLTGETIGYYTVNGKVSSAGVQNAPEQDLIKGWESVGEGEDLYIVDSAKDDGTYGPSETGFFFFTTENVLIEIEGLAYVQSDAPIRLFIDAPLLNEQ